MTFEEAKNWAIDRSKIYTPDQKVSLIVCKWNDSYIVQDTKFILQHIKEYEVGELVFCTNESQFQEILSSNFGVNIIN